MKSVRIEICVIEMLYTPNRIQPYTPKLKEEILSILDYTKKLDYDMKRKINKTENIAYYLYDYKHDDKSNFIHIDMGSGKFNRQRRVRNVYTNVDKGVQKDKPDADEEHTFSTLYFPEEDECYCAFTHNSDGIGISKFMQYINHVANIYCKNLHRKQKFYRFEYRILVDKDFLTELNKMDRISMTKILVDSDEFVDSEYRLNSADVRDDIEVVYKPVSRGLSMGRDFVKRLEKLKKKGRIKRIIADGAIGKNRIRIDTEEMKTKDEITVETNNLDEIKWTSVSEILEMKLIDYLQPDEENKNAGFEDFEDEEDEYKERVTV